MKSYKTNEVIFNKGDFELCMYSIVSGKIGIYQDYASAGEKMLVALEPGKFFGEMGLLDRMPRSATAVALEDSELDVITEDVYEDFLRKNPDKTLELMRHMSDRIRSLTADYMDACHTIAEMNEASGASAKKPGKLAARIAKYMKIWEDTYADLPPEAARMVNFSPETQLHSHIYF